MGAGCRLCPMGQPPALDFPQFTPWRLTEICTTCRAEERAGCHRFPEKWRTCAVAARLGSAQSRNLANSTSTSSCASVPACWSSPATLVATGENGDAGLHATGRSSRNIARCSSSDHSVKHCSGTWCCPAGAHRDLAHARRRCQTGRLMTQFRAGAVPAAAGRCSYRRSAMSGASRRSAGADGAKVCAQVITPPSTWTLLRLWRFAHPYRWRLRRGSPLASLTAALCAAT